MACWQLVANCATMRSQTGDKKMGCKIAVTCIGSLVRFRNVNYGFFFVLRSLNERGVLNGEGDLGDRDLKWRWRTTKNINAIFQHKDCQVQMESDGNDRVESIDLELACYLLIFVPSWDLNEVICDHFGSWWARNRQLSWRIWHDYQESDCLIFAGLNYAILWEGFWSFEILIKTFWFSQQSPHINQHHKKYSDNFFSNLSPHFLPNSPRTNAHINLARLFRIVRHSATFLPYFGGLPGEFNSSHTYVSQTGPEKIFLEVVHFGFKMKASRNDVNVLFFFVEIRAAFDILKNLTKYTKYFNY